MIKRLPLLLFALLVALPLQAARDKISPTQIQPAGRGGELTFGDSAVANSSTAELVVPRACTITGWSLIGDQSGSITCTVSKATPSGGAVSYSTISASAPPALSSATTSTSTTLTGWTTAIAAGDVVRVVFSGVTGVTRINLKLHVTYP